MFATTTRYGGHELDLIARRDIPHRRKIKGLLGYMLNVYRGEDEDHNVEKDGFNDRLLFCAERGVKIGRRRCKEYTYDIGLGPLRLLNVSLCQCPDVASSRPPSLPCPP